MKCKVKATNRIETIKGENSVMAEIDGIVT